jgi:hypothetical protein
MLGLADTRDIIEDHRDLARIFKKASNDGFLLIATTILSVELLARDFSGWGKRFPAARCKAEKVLNNSPQPRRTWLMDLYLFRPPGVPVTCNCVAPVDGDPEVFRSRDDPIKRR